MSAITRYPPIEILLRDRYNVSANRGLVMCPLYGVVR